MPTRLSGSLLIRLSYRRRPYLLEHFEQIELVPVFCELRILNSPDVDASQLDWGTVGAITHEWFRKGSVVRETSADAVALFDYVLNRNLGIGKCVEVMPKERLNAARPRLHLRVVIVVLRVNELIEEFDAFLIQRLREQPWEMFVAHEILHDSEFVVLYCHMSRYCHICQCRRKNGGFEKGSWRVPGGRDDASNGWALEGHESVASTGRTEAYQRTQAFDSWNYGAHADPASSGTCCRRHRQKR